MTIGISSSSYQFSASRLERVLKSKNLEDAQQMGIWDSIKDFFQGGVKRQAIEQLFNDLQDYACSDDTSHEGSITQLIRFQKMKFSAKEEHQNKFKVWLNMDKANNSWSYMLEIDNKIVAKQQLNYDRNDKNSRNAFMHFQVLQVPLDRDTREADFTNKNFKERSRLTSRRHSLHNISYPNKHNDNKRNLNKPKEQTPQRADLSGSLKEIRNHKGFKTDPNVNDNNQESTKRTHKPNKPNEDTSNNKIVNGLQAGYEAFLDRHPHVFQTNKSDSSQNSDQDADEWDIDESTDNNQQGSNQTNAMTQTTSNTGAPPTKSASNLRPQTFFNAGMQREDLAKLMKQKVNSNSRSKK